jgi:hypothetical protein
MIEQLSDFLRKRLDGADSVSIEHFEPIPGGFSRETFRFDARVSRNGTDEVLPLILRKDPPAAAAIFTSLVAPLRFALDAKTLRALFSPASLRLRGLRALSSGTSVVRSNTA